MVFVLAAFCEPFKYENLYPCDRGYAPCYQWCDGYRHCETGVSDEDRPVTPENMYSMYAFDEVFCRDEDWYWEFIHWNLTRTHNIHELLG